MRTTIAKQFRWEMGHRLPDHPGLCKNIHGHSYEAQVILVGEPDESGMVMDYFDLKTMVQPLIDRTGPLLSPRHDPDSRFMKSVLLEHHPMKVVEIDVPTTAENIAQYLLESHHLSAYPPGTALRKR